MVGQALRDDEGSGEASTEGAGVNVANHLHSVIERRRSGAGKGDQEDRSAEERESEGVHSGLRGVGS